MLVPMKSAFASLVLLTVLIGALLGAPAVPAVEAAEDGKDAKDKPAPTEAARKNAIKGLKSKISKMAKSAHAERKTAEILEALEALEALGGKEAGRAAMYAVPHPAEQVRDKAFELIEKENDKSFVKPLVQMLEDKRYRRDPDAKRRIAHALAVIAQPTAIEPLSELIRFDEDPEVVAEVADALATFATAKVALRKPAVKRLVDLYESTWNLKESVRQDHKDKLLKKEAEKRYKVYGKTLRHALQALTGVQLTRPAEWRRWWNSNKKRNKWGRHSVMPKERRGG